MLKITFLLLVCACVLSAGEGTIPFRSGKILSAEISSQKPVISSNKVKDTPNGVWAEVVVKLNPGRTLGCMDYFIESDGTKYPCRAIARNQEKYDADVWEITDPIEGDKFRMLFNPPKSSDGKNVYDLKFTFRAHPEYPKVEFKNKDSGDFTQVSEIPASGVMGKDAAPAAASPEKQEK